MSLRGTIAGATMAAALTAVLTTGSVTPAAAQGTGYGVGEWDLVTQGGASVCRMVLSARYIPEMANYRVFQRRGPRCTDWRAQHIFMWVVRGNELKFADSQGREILSLHQQNPNLYATGEFALYRRGTRQRY